MQSVWENKDKTAELIKNLKNGKTVGNANTQTKQGIAQTKKTPITTKDDSFNEKEQNEWRAKKTPITTKDDSFNEKEQNEWRAKYNPKTLKLGMVPPSAFVDLNDKELFKMLRERIRNFEDHVGEKLPEDFKKYISYCGPMFFNWSCCGISLHGWNEEDEKDQRPWCMWCDQPMANTKCKSKQFFDGKDLNNSEAPGLVRFSHEGCGFFKFIVVKGPLKGSIYSGNPNGDGNYLSKDKSTFKQLLDDIYKKPKK